MKSKKALSMLLTTICVLSVLALPGIPNVGADFPTDQPTVWVSNQTYFDEANLTCAQDFNISINVFNVTGMKGLAIILTYNTTLLDCNRVYDTPISAGAPVKLPIDGGVFHYDSAPTINESIGGGLGQVWMSFFGFTTFTGSGTVYKFEFHITHEPPRDEYAVPTNKSVSCALTLAAGTQILDASSVEIPSHKHNGYYEYIRPQKVVGDPTAICQVNPASVYVGNNVTFDGSSSLDGGAPPLTYLWDVDSDGTYDVNTTSSTSSWANPVAGNFNVTLTVVNNATIPRNNTAAPQYWDVVEKAGAVIDLYTSPNRWCGVDTSSSLPGEGIGIGDDMPCDALSPDVNVSLFAEVTYNGAPVNHVLVAFEVRWVWNISWCEYVPDNATWDLVDECVLFRTAETNKTGVATINFRVPTPCEGQMFGKWKAWAKTKVQEVPIEDTMEFDVGYLVMMCDLVILDPYPDVFVREVDSLSANITFKSISWISRFVKFFIVVYDECDVPIGQAFIDVWTDPAEYCSPTGDTITVSGIPIPQWAYVGYGSVYASAFTDFPHACGIPYCPGLSVTDIYVDWTP